MRVLLGDFEAPELRTDGLWSKTALLLRRHLHEAESAGHVPPETISPILPVLGVGSVVRVGVRVVGPGLPF